MNALIRLLRVEFLIIRRSKALPVSIVVSVPFPSMLTFMVFAMKHADLARDLGLLGRKATLMGKADWPSLLAFLGQGMSGLEIVLFGFLTAWSFGREYAEGTLKDLLTLPVSRVTLATAKLLSVSIWSLLLLCLMLVLSLTGAFLVQLPLWNAPELLTAVMRIFLAGLATIYLNSVFAFAACYYRSMLAPVGCVILTAVLINFAGAIGIAAFYPWAIPMYFTQIDGGVMPDVIGWALLLLTGGAGSVGTLSWWTVSDHDGQA